MKAFNKLREYISNNKRVQKTDKKQDTVRQQQLLAATSAQPSQLPSQAAPGPASPQALPYAACYTSACGSRGSVASYPAASQCPAPSYPAAPRDSQAAQVPGVPTAQVHCTAGHRYALQPQNMAQPVQRQAPAMGYPLPFAQGLSASRGMAVIQRSREASAERHTKKQQEKQDKRLQKKLQKEELEKHYREIKKQYKYQQMKEQIYKKNGGSQQLHTAGQSTAAHTMTGLGVLDFAKIFL